MKYYTPPGAGSYKVACASCVYYDQERLHCDLLDADLSLVNVESDTWCNSQWFLPTPDASRWIPAKDDT